MSKNKLKSLENSRKNKKNNKFNLMSKEIVSFREANQVRIALKMPLSCFSWFKSISVESDNGKFLVKVYTSKLNELVKETVREHVRNVIYSFNENVQVRVESEN